MTHWPFSGSTDLTKEPEFPNARLYSGRTSVGTGRAAGFYIEFAFVM